MTISASVPPVFFRSSFPMPPATEQDGGMNGLFSNASAAPNSGLLKTIWPNAFLSDLTMCVSTKSMAETNRHQRHDRHARLGAKLTAETREAVTNKFVGQRVLLI